MTDQQLNRQQEEATTAIDIYQHFRGLIVSGQLGADERLPTVRQTSGDLAVAIGTAAKAYKMLEQDGLVISRTAAGTRVAPNAAVVPVALLHRLRESIVLAHNAGIPLEDVVSVIRASWPSSSASH